ncbi:hypothetical protein GUJ93_ZPchr0003g18211 [Zizania palustris]|uniref:CDP-diacylglycerol--glycerol-3-phosphate 3-phosphatidyltransferase n=1 Tax=Zizania palustris TaxID=103762 RepID=A0A8J5VEU3_ZIZPA|nr:hypothetical protein GUJ93_ZPchr0003g18211 [Zizania palustris]
MPPSVATHASLLHKTAAAAALPAHLHPKPFFSPRAGRIPSPQATAASRRSLPPPPKTTATATRAAACRWFRWPPPAPARGLCSLPHSGVGSGGEGMGSDVVGRRRRVAPTVNGVAKEGAPQPAPPRLLTLPTVLTIGRVAAVPLLITTFYMDGPWAATATTGIFLAAAITDWLDGYIARKMQLGTPFGAFLDPVADKLMVAATLVLLCTKPLETSLLRDGPWLLTVPAIAIIGREETGSMPRSTYQGQRFGSRVGVNAGRRPKTPWIAIPMPTAGSGSVPTACGPPQQPQGHRCGGRRALLRWPPGFLILAARTTPTPSFGSTLSSCHCRLDPR